MPRVTVRATTTWRTKFMRLESDFFSIVPGDWQAAQGKALKNLGLSYQTAVHEFHATLLNTRLELRPRLNTGDFSGDTTLGDLKVLVRGRVPPSDTTLDVDLPAGESLASLGLPHLEVDPK